MTDVGEERPGGSARHKGEMRGGTRMADPGKDPSMEDILTSIRRIVDDDGAAHGSGGDEPLVLTEIVDEKPGPDAASPAPVAPKAGGEGPAPEAVAPSPPAAPAGESVLSEAARDRVLAAMAPLAEGVRQRAAASGRPLEELVMEQLTPMLGRWLDEHLPAIVERVVERELRALARRLEDGGGR